MGAKREYEVKPFPREWCVGCTFNGCYPWCKNPLLRCHLLGGLVPAMIASDEEIERSCLTYQPVTEESWQTHLADLKQEAKVNEEVKLKAMHGKITSNTPMPDN